MAKQDMLINYVPGEECRIAITEDGRLEELYTERTSADLHVGNIYRGRVTNVEASIQAAFVDFGLERSGFLHITDLHPRYFPGKHQEDTERVGHKTPRRERPPMQQCLRRGQEIVVQVLKEGIGSKGPTVTSYLSIPGRFLVMMPWMERHGVSRKIDDPEKRKAMRTILDELDPPEDLGFIVRTAGFERTKTELKRDLNYLLRLWKDINARMKVGKGPAELYTESDLIIRTLRDVVTTDVKRIIVDDRVAAVRSKQFLRIAMPRTTTKVIHHTGPVPLFDAFEIEQQIQQINERQVPLKCGGSLVFDSTEALVAIDVNSGKFRDAKDSEDSAYRTNLEAVEEIARQLRLRDLGGLLVLDLIDMYVHRHRREVERRFRDAMKKDRARSKVLKISDLGMLEMTRQRMRPSLKKSIYNECPTCMGSGQVLSAESVVLKVMRQLAVALSHDRVARSQLLASADVVTELSNRKRDALVNLERRSGKSITVDIDLAAGPDTVRLICFDATGNKLELDKLAKPKKPNFSDDDEISLEDVKEFERTQPTLMSEADEVDDVDDLDEVDEEPKAASNSESDSSATGDEETGEGGKKKRRRRRRRRRKPGDEAEGASEAPSSSEPAAAAAASASARTTGYEGSAAGASSGDVEAASGDESAGGEGDTEGDHGEGPKKKRRRRRRGGRRHRKNKADSSESTGPSDDQSADADSELPDEAIAKPETLENPDQSAEDQPPAPPKKKRRRRRRKSADAAAAEDGEKSGESESEPETAAAPESES